jgi:CubicO group peptidase (beta-lactamase class C family)
LRYLLLILCLLAVPAWADELDRAISAGLAAEKLDGAVWALVTPDGTRTGAAGSKIGDGTRMYTGSVAKTVLAAGVLRLASSGKLSLDADVAQLLPALRFNNPWQATDPIRVRHLLAHTAGIENFRFWQVFSHAARADTPLAAALDGSPGLLRASTRPGAQYAYSNTGYLLLGMVIESVTGRRYEDYLNAELLQPLGMRDSSAAFATQAGPNADVRLAMGHFENGMQHAALPAFLRPSDQFTTSAADMARFARFLMSDGSVNGKPFIAPAYMAQLIVPVDTDAAKAGLRTGHGLALAVRDRNQSLGGCHPGTSLGFRAMLCIYPEQGKAFFIAINTDSETADYERFNRLLGGALQLAPPLAPGGAAAPTGIESWQGAYIPMASAVAALRWLDVVFNPLAASWNGKELVLNPMQGQAIRLAPAGGMLLRAQGRAQASHVLLEGPVISDGLRSYQRVAWVYLILLWASMAAGAAGLLYVLNSGLRGAWRRSLRAGDAIAVPLACTLALLLPVPFLLSQSFLQLGERTLGNMLLAIVTGLMLPGFAFGLVRAFAQRGKVREKLALAAVLQWLAVLVAWGMIPFLLWR